MHLLSEFRGRFKRNNRRKSKRDLEKEEREREKKQKFYYERGVRVDKGSKLDKAIKEFRKKGYYCTETDGKTIKGCPPTLRPSFGSTSHAEIHKHPLIPESEHE